MPKGLRRLHGGGDLHFITCSCYQRRKLLGSASRRDLFLRIFEEARQRYDFVVVEYVVMPEHFHILISEPRIEPLAIAMQVLKQRVSVKYPKSELAPTFWLPRYHDFNVFTNEKKVEKLRYMHRNPGPPASPLLACWGGSPSNAVWLNRPTSGHGAAGATTAMVNEAR